MSVEERIAALHGSGKRDEAATLARAALRNDAVRSVELGTDRVDVTTASFVGHHAIARWTDGEPVVESAGEYALREDERVGFDVGVLHDHVFAAIEAAESNDGHVGARDAVARDVASEERDAVTEGRDAPRAGDASADDRRATF
ncbi:hypothetical protein J2752_000034 [Halarchaeum rubridurum]|uniref:Uncharacterized protein n=1 Tax=Halarchaeum rubridurum TaxID=489911 RepID=A0A830FW96_9EURY|nr:hypothetical protein [Halarchaeum rubridurum]MBP1953153.1 hypothetical protein [Halarchaeum rubridurum]GGM67483.1 hypothetical protein GCM10009017_17020 [Halarchaeum rubridurum]